MRVLAQHRSSSFSGRSWIGIAPAFISFPLLEKPSSPQRHRGHRGRYLFFDREVPIEEKLRPTEIPLCFVAQQGKETFHLSGPSSENVSEPSARQIKTCFSLCAQCLCGEKSILSTSPRGWNPGTVLSISEPAKEGVPPKTPATISSTPSSYRPYSPRTLILPWN